MTLYVLTHASFIIDVFPVSLLLLIFVVSGYPEYSIFQIEIFSLPDKPEEYWMLKAIALAEQAAKNNEVPVGAVVVFDGQIIGRGSNAPIGNHDPTAHAEIIALQEAAKSVANYRLIDADIYVTLEPCAMCAGAIIHSRIRRLYFGAYEPKSGAVCSHIRLLEQPCMNHSVEVIAGICAEQCQAVISQFFRRRRAEQKALKQHQ